MLFQAHLNNITLQSNPAGIGTRHNGQFGIACLTYWRAAQKLHKIKQLQEVKITFLLLLHANTGLLHLGINLRDWDLILSSSSLISSSSISKLILLILSCPLLYSTSLHIAIVAGLRFLFSDLLTCCSNYFASLLCSRATSIKSVKYIFFVVAFIML